MADSAKKGRAVLKGIDASGPVPVEYRFAHSKGGNRHLTVVFANLFAPDDYGWATGVLDGLRSNILWIRDSFDGGNTYYLCKGMDFSVEKSVIGLISRVMESLALTPNDVTLWGSSKGASAALYFGLRYGFRNIVASVPQIRIGTFVRDVYPNVGRHMLGEAIPEENVRVLDAVLPDLLASGANPEARIYLVSSPQDEQYKDQVEPFVGLLRRYRNFNFIFSESPHITDHGKVSLRNVPPLLGIAYLLVEGIAPAIGITRHGYEEPGRDTSGIEGFLKATSVVQEAFSRPTVTAPAENAMLPVGPVLFTGTAPGAVRVSIWESGKYLASAPVGTDGRWSWQGEAAWSEGEHLVRLFAVDPHGFQSHRTDARFAVSATATAYEPGGVPAGSLGGTPVRSGTGAEYNLDAGPLPAPVVRMPEAHQRLPETVRFAGLAVGAASVGLREGGFNLGMCPVAPDGTWLWDAGAAWAEGAHVVEVFAVDAVGRESPPVPVPFMIVRAQAGTVPYGH
ncbi:hypothetical protein G3I32_24675 [Streptomyces coelicoflavus]|uniref:Bacterial Ig-like domain-containing protein n=1 Tax=Streptomyces coelicoflavus TaxID=285562 RepID=A0A7K3PPW1_9ACTN|nr:hypothetical protein [Streptomyces coelicoflavus]NEB11998.1 hypothetical protein [Streptomyces coelicoflavus]